MRTRLCCAALTAALLLPWSTTALAEDPAPKPSPPSEEPPAAPAAPRREVPPCERTVAETYERPIEGSDLVIGGATIGIEATVADIRRILLAYHRYRTILPRIRQSRVVAQEGGTTDVYLRAPILNGLSALWGIARFGRPTAAGDKGFELSGSLLKGNIDAWRGQWRVQSCGEKRTLLTIEQFIDLGMPLPNALVNQWLLWSCAKAVTAVRDVAEFGRSSVSED